MGKAPVLNRTYVGRKGKYCHRRCPYATQDITDRIPTAEKTDHSDTGGRMDPVMMPGVGIVFKCNSESCPFYLGTAVTELNQSVNDLTISGGEYIYTERLVPIAICSGTRFQEY